MTFGTKLPTYPPPVHTGITSGIPSATLLELARCVPPDWLEEINVPGLTSPMPTRRVIDWHMDYVVNFDCVGKGADIRRRVIYEVAKLIDPDYRKTGTTNIYLRSALSYFDVRNRFACVTKARDHLTVGRVAYTVYTIDDTMVRIHPMNR
ncbi:MAG: hypothetical protein ACK4GK_12340 [Ferrovibrio sp.]